MTNEHRITWVISLPFICQFRELLESFSFKIFKDKSLFIALILKVMDMFVIRTEKSLGGYAHMPGTGTRTLFEALTDIRHMLILKIRTTRSQDDSTICDLGFGRD